MRINIAGECLLQLTMTQSVSCNERTNRQSLTICGCLLRAACTSASGTSHALTWSGTRYSSFHEHTPYQTGGSAYGKCDQSAPSTLAYLLWLCMMKYIHLIRNPVMHLREDGLLSLKKLNLNESMCACLQVEMVKDVLFANIFYSFDNFCKYIPLVFIEIMWI